MWDPPGLPQGGGHLRPRAGLGGPDRGSLAQRTYGRHQRRRASEQADAHGPGSRAMLRSRLSRCNQMDMPRGSRNGRRTRTRTDIGLNRGYGRDIGSLMELFALLEGRSEDVRADRPTHHRRCVRRHRDRVGDFLHFHRSRVPGGRGGLLWRAVQSNCRIELHIHGGRFRRSYLGGRGADSRRDLPLSRRRNRQTRRSPERHSLKGGGLLPL